MHSYLTCLKHARLLLVTAALALLAACGGGGGTPGAAAGAGTDTTVAIVDSFGDAVSSGDGSGVGAGDSGADGSAGEGKPFANATIVITSANNRSVTVTANAQGYYRAKVTGFTAPLVVRATNEAGKSYTSLTTTAPPTNGFVTINVTGLTDKVASDVAVAGGASGAAALTPAIVASNASVIATSIASIQTTLSTQLTAAGITPATFNPITLPFRTNGTGYDAVLDTTLVSQTGTGATQITPSGQVVVAGLNTSGIATLVSEFNRLNQTQLLRTSIAFANLIDDLHLDDGENKTDFLSYFTNSVSDLAGNITSFSFSGCVNATAAAPAVCNAAFTFVDANGATQQVTDNKVRLTNGVWRLYGNQVPVNFEFASWVSKHQWYQTGNTALSGLASTSVGYLVYLQKSAIAKSAKVYYYGTTGATASQPILLQSLNDKSSCTTSNNLAVDDPTNSSNIYDCGDIKYKTDAEINALNADFSTGSVILKVEVYPQVNYGGTPVIFTRAFNQVLRNSADDASAPEPIISNLADLSTASVAFTLPAGFSLQGIRLTVRKGGVTHPYSYGTTTWDGSALRSLGNTVTMAAAEALCNNCGSYTTTNNGQISELTFEGRDATGRTVSVTHHPAPH